MEQDRMLDTRRLLVFGAVLSGLLALVFVAALWSSSTSRSYGPGPAGVAESIAGIEQSVLYLGLTLFLIALALLLLVSAGAVELVRRQRAGARGKDP